MKKTILLVMGSPNSHGNTNALAEAFREGAEAVGHKVEKILLSEKKIGGCMGCRACMEKQGQCIQKDDMESIRAMFDSADVIVFASPLYYWSFCAQMKAFLDRLFASNCHKGPKCPQKSCALIVTAGSNGPDIFAPITCLYTYGYINRLGWENLGMVLAGGYSQTSAFQQARYAEQARALGECIK